MKDYTSERPITFDITIIAIFAVKIDETSDTPGNVLQNISPK